LSQGTTQLILQLVIKLPLLILKPTKILGLRDDTDCLLPGLLEQLCLRLPFNLLLELIGSILALLEQVINSLKVFIKFTLVLLFFQLLCFHSYQNFSVPLGLGLDVKSVDRLVGG